MLTYLLPVVDHYNKQREIINLASERVYFGPCFYRFQFKIDGPLAFRPEEKWGASGRAKVVTFGPGSRKKGGNGGDQGSIIPLETHPHMVPTFESSTNLPNQIDSGGQASKA